MFPFRTPCVLDVQLPWLITNGYPQQHTRLFWASPVPQCPPSFQVSAVWRAPKLLSIPGELFTCQMGRSPGGSPWMPGGMASKNWQKIFPVVEKIHKMWDEVGCFMLGLYGIIMVYHLIPMAKYENTTQLPIQGWRSKVMILSLFRQAHL